MRENAKICRRALFAAAVCAMTLAAPAFADHRSGGHSSAGHWGGSSGWHYHPGWHGNIRHFDHSYWRGGHWWHGTYNTRLGWCGSSGPIGIGMPRRFIPILTPIRRPVPYPASGTGATIIASTIPMSAFVPQVGVRYRRHSGGPSVNGEGLSWRNPSPPICRASPAARSRSTRAAAGKGAAKSGHYRVAPAPI